MEAIDLRAQLIELGADNFLETSLDPYAAARSAYLQRRQALILDQDGAATSGSEGVNPDDFDFAPENSASAPAGAPGVRSEEHTSELQSLMRTSYAVFCLKKKK